VIFSQTYLVTLFVWKAFYIGPAFPPADLLLEFIVASITKQI
jgi:uncharacterized protein Usg